LDRETRPAVAAPAAAWMRAVAAATEGGSHSIWRNPVTNEIQAIPRHSEIGENLVRKICRKLSLPDPS